MMLLCRTCITVAPPPPVAECSVVSLQSELQCLQGQLLELQSQLVTKEQEVASLQAALGLLQGNCREKIRVRREPQHWAQK